MAQQEKNRRVKNMTGNINQVEARKAAQIGGNRRLHTGKVPPLWPVKAFCVNTDRLLVK